MFLRVAPSFSGRSFNFVAINTTQYRSYARGAKGEKITPVKQEDSFFELKRAKSFLEAKQ